MKAQKILFATDYSESSKFALSFAETIARESGGLLLIAHVCEAEQYPVEEHCDNVVDNPAEVARLKAVVPADATVRHEHRLLYGDPGSAVITKPASVIVNLAEKEPVDVIVLGTHGRSGISRALMGSVAETVLHKARCSVVVVKPQYVDR
jgi:nucleotide-binding universal stress UspA family protein